MVKIEQMNSFQQRWMHVLRRIKKNGKVNGKESK